MNELPRSNNTVWISLWCRFVYASWTDVRKAAHDTAVNSHHVLLDNTQQQHVVSFCKQHRNSSHSIQQVLSIETPTVSSRHYDTKCVLWPRNWLIQKSPLMTSMLASINRLLARHSLCRKQAWYCLRSVTDTNQAQLLNLSNNCSL